MGIMANCQLMKIISSRLALFAFFLAPIAATAPVSAQSAKPLSPAKATFTSKKYGFSLYLPQTPQTQKKALPAQIGGGSTDIYFTPPNPVSYSIVPIVLPAAARNIPQKLYFDSVQQGIVQSAKGKAVGSRDVKVNGLTARDFLWSFSTPTPESKTPVTFAGQTRIYKVGLRTYQFTAVVKSSDKAKNQAQINKVLGSIVIAK